MKGKKTGGRAKGTPNQVTGTLKELILQALSDVGGVEYMRLQALRNPNAFLALVGRVLPLQVKDDDGEPRMPKPPVIHECKD